MKKHKKIYAEFFNLSPDEFAPCERCIQLQSNSTKRLPISRAVDVHHCDRRGMGGDQTGEKDVIENLGGVCRHHHERLDAYPSENDEFKKWCADLDSRICAVTKIIINGS